VQVNKNKRNNESSFKNCSYRIDKSQLVVNEQPVTETFDYPLIKHIVVSPFCNKRKDPTCHMRSTGYILFIKSTKSFKTQRFELNDITSKCQNFLFEQVSGPPIYP
jgi:hypothetical protein